MTFRTERDPLGELQVPANAYYGIHTQRALENFPISGLRAPAELVTATVLIKKAAAEANMALGRLAPDVGRAIVAAADEVLGGALRDQFVVDVYQAGAGTSHNMNVNEVLANRAAELLGEPRGRYALVHPNDHVNMSQSTNDVFPAATRLALLLLTPGLVEAAQALARSFERKSREFDNVLKTGRTHLQDAVPITLGQELSGYAASVARGAEDVEQAARQLLELNLGATAVGTGLNAGEDYTALAVERLRHYTGLDLKPAVNRFRVTQSMGDVLAFSGAVRRLAVEVSKIASDLRLLSMGPRAGLAEITLPAVQPGSSIMPGKINPSIPEMVNQVCYQVIGCDTTIMMACEAGELELNVMMPVIAWNAIHEVTILRQALKMLRLKCVDGIEANVERCRELLDRSTAVATALSPYLGYARTAEVAAEAVATGRSIREVVLARGLMDPETLDRVLSPEAMTKPGLPGRTDEPAPTSSAAATVGVAGAPVAAREPATGVDRPEPAARAAISPGRSRAPRSAGPRRLAKTRARHGRSRDRRRRGRR